MNLKTLLVAAVICSLPRTHAQTAEDPLHGYAGYTNSYFLPYSNDPGFGSKNPEDATVTILIGSLKTDVNVDTGSRGLYLDSETLGSNVTPASNSFPGEINLTSSHRVYAGNWVTTQVSFDVLDQNSNPTTVTATADILDVETLGCSGPSTTYDILGTKGKILLTNGKKIDYKDGKVTLTTGEYMAYSNNEGLLPPVSNFGIGFDLNGHGTGPVTNNANQIYNVLLNLDAMASGDLVQGYIITPTGIQLGLTEKETNYAFTQLQPTGFTNSNPAIAPDWQTPTGTVTYKGETNIPGMIVLDSGIGYSFLSLPTLKSGALSNPPLSITLLNSEGGVGYNITQDSDNLLNPSFQITGDSSNNVKISVPAGGIYTQNKAPWGRQYFNSGRNVFSAFNMLYDAQNGYMGLIPNEFGATNPNLIFQSGYYPSPLPLPAVTGLNAQAGNNEVTLTWTPSQLAAAYSVSVNSSYTQPYVLYTTNNTIKTLTTNNGHPYEFSVKYITPQGNVSQSTSTNATPAPPLPPTPPTEIAARPLGNTIEIKYSTVENATFYIVYRSTTSGGPFTKIATTTSTIYTDANISSGTKYYYVVATCNGVSISADSKQASATVP